MREFRLYILFASLFMFFVSSCKDGENDASLVSSIDKKCSLTVSVGMPEITTAVDVSTRSACLDYANIDDPTLANGGKFQNLVVALVKYKTAASITLVDLYCMNLNDGVGVEREACTFYDLDAGTYSLLVWGNIPDIIYDDWYSLMEYERGKTKWKNISQYVNSLNAFVRLESKLPDFGLGKSYKFDYTSSNNSSSTTYNAESRGMPVSLEIQSLNVDKGANNVNVLMKRICARLLVVVNNNTGGEIKVTNFELTNAAVERGSYFENVAITYKSISNVNLIEDLTTEECVIEPGGSFYFSGYVLGQKSSNVYNYIADIEKADGTLLHYDAKCPYTNIARNENIILNFNVNQ